MIRVSNKDSIDRTLQTILLSFEKLGYNVSWRLIECQIFGIPQLRKRVFITGTSKLYKADLAQVLRFNQDLSLFVMVHEFETNFILRFYQF